MPSREDRFGVTGTPAGACRSCGQRARLSVRRAHSFLSWSREKRQTGDKRNKISVALKRQCSFFAQSFYIICCIFHPFHIVCFSPLARLYSFTYNYDSTDFSALSFFLFWFALSMER